MLVRRVVQLGESSLLQMVGPLLVPCFSSINIRLIKWVVVWKIICPSLLSLLLCKCYHYQYIPVSVDSQSVELLWNIVPTSAFCADESYIAMSCCDCRCECDVSELAEARPLHTCSWHFVSGPTLHFLSLKDPNLISTLIIGKHQGVDTS